MEATAAAEELVRKAEEVTGLTDWCTESKDDIIQPLSLLLKESTGRGDKDYLNLLTTRLLLEEEFKKAGSDVMREFAPVKPVVIVGLPRTGSTFLHRLLSQDEEHLLSPKLWEMRRPVDTPELPSPQARFEHEKAHWDNFHRENPQFEAIHNVRAEYVGECLSAMEYDMVCGTFVFRGKTPNYTQWYLHMSAERARASYRFHRRFMTLLHHKRFTQQGQKARQWIWKAPLHTLFLDAIIDVYPDVQFIWTHRDPICSIPSTCYLSDAMQGFASAKSSLGQALLSVFSLAITRAMHVRAQQSNSARFIDVYMHELSTTNSIDGVLARIYSNVFNAEWFTGKTRDTMLTWAQDNSNSKSDQSQQQPQLEDYGLTKENVQQAFEAYTKQYFNDVK